MRSFSLILIFSLILSGAAIAQGTNASPLLELPFAVKSSKALPLAVAFGDGNSEVSAEAIEQLRSAGKFDILVFSPDLPTITRAVLERRIPADAVKNPNDPEKALIITRSLGAQYAVRIQGKVEGSKANVVLELLKIPEGRWATTAESDIAAGDGPRAVVNRNSAISTAVSSAVAQLFIDAFGGLPTNPPGAEPPKTVTPSLAPALAEPPRTTEPETPKTTVAEPPRDVTAEYNNIIRVVDSFSTKGDLRNAVVALKQAVNLEPDKPAARIRLAQMYADLGMSDQAIDECKRTLLFDGDSVPVHALLAKLYLANGSLAEAADQCNEVVRIDPKNVEARMNLGDISWNLAKVDDAVAAYEGAIAADPKNPAPHERLQRLYAARKMYPQAIEHLVEARSLSQDVGQDQAKRYEILAQVIQDEFGFAVGKLASAKTDFDDDKITREDYYADCQDLTSRVEALAGYLMTQTAPRAYKDVHARALLAASLLAQAGGDMISYFETEQQHYLEDADLLRIEAETEMKNFVAGLRTTAQPASSKQGNG